MDVHKFVTTCCIQFQWVSVVTWYLSTLMLDMHYFHNLSNATFLTLSCFLLFKMISTRSAKSQMQERHDMKIIKYEILNKNTNYDFCWLYVFIILHTHTHNSGSFRVCTHIMNTAILSRNSIHAMLKKTGESNLWMSQQLWPTGECQLEDSLRTVWVVERFCVFPWELVKSESRFAFKAIIWVS